MNEFLIFACAYFYHFGVCALHKRSKKILGCDNKLSYILVKDSFSKDNLKLTVNSIFMFLRQCPKWGLFILGIHLSSRKIDFPESYSSFSMNAQQAKKIYFLLLMILRKCGTVLPGALMNYLQ